MHATNFADVGGVNTRYFEAGFGAPLLLIHGGNFGWDGSADEFVPILDGLAKDFRVLAVDRLGQGMTDNPTNDGDYVVGGWVQHIFNFIATLRLGPVHLVGHSRGGYVACRLALEHPEIARTVTIVDSATLMIPPRFNKVEGVSDLRDWAYQTMAAHSFSAEHITADLIDAMVELRELPKMLAAREKFASLREAFAHDLGIRQAETHKWIKDGRLETSTLIVWGFNDPSAPWNDVGSKTIDLILPNSRDAQARVINKAGHYCFREQPREFVSAVTSFIKERYG